MSILLEMVKRALGGVYRDVSKIGSAKAFHLGVEVGKVTSLQQRIVAEIDAGDNIIGTEGDLLSLREEVIYSTI